VNATIIVRPAVVEDAEGIAHAFVETWRATYPGMLPDRVLINMSDEAQAGYWARTLAARRARELVRVAVSGKGTVLGFGSAGPERRGASRRGEIYTLYIRPDWQNRGLGRRIICTLFQGLRDRGYRSAMLWVLAANPSRFFYEAVGGRRAFEQTERLWGIAVPQIGYLWGDLAPLFAEGGRCRQP
jgi:ribosomal protein S18 acetylase RimI-like enzyme